MTTNRRDRFVDALSSGQPFPQGNAGHAVHPRELARGIHTAVARKGDVASRVVALLDLGCPAAVCRLVVAIVIDAVDRMARWARSHVAQERGERLPPFVAHGDATPAVVRERLSTRVKAAALGVLPGTVFARPSPIDGRTMDSRARLRLFPLQAATTFLTAASQIAAQSRNSQPAIAAADPVPVVATFFGSGFHNESAKPLARNIDPVIASLSWSRNPWGSHAVPPFRGRDWSGVERCISTARLRLLYRALSGTFGSNTETAP